jgi:HCO3- transporter family.
MTNFNQRTVAVSLLLFITVIAPTLTFGAVYGSNTEFHIGAVETILATAWMGVFFSLFSGMPMVSLTSDNNNNTRIDWVLCRHSCWLLTLKLVVISFFFLLLIVQVIVGSTGPVLIMTTVIYDMAKNIGIPFLTFYAWVSIWAFVYTTITAFFDLTRYVKLATRFTDDIFALLIVSIFILNAVGNPFGAGGLLQYLDPRNKVHADFEKELGVEEYRYLTTALLSIIIGFATTGTIFTLRSLKMSPYLCNQTIRDSVHDFAVTVAVIVWSVIKHYGFPSVETEQLKVPDAFEPTYACCTSDCTTYWPDECPDLSTPFGTRSWFPKMFDLNGKDYAIAVAAGPALLAFVLFYLDNGITWHLIYSPRNKLQHGDSYNWDLFLNGFCNMINGLLGLPWLVATTVPCIVHLNNLTEKDHNGKVVKVQETRLTYFISHLLVGLSLLFLPVMKQIPMPVLLGVFLFMGLSSLGGIDFWKRFLMFFQQPSLYAQTPFTKYMKPSRIDMYTIAQLIFLQVCLLFKT